MKKMRIVVTGFIGLYPSGGVTWDYVQYPLGFHLLGHDVFYLEDTMQYARYQSQGQKWDDASDSIAYLKGIMERFGLGDKWVYRDVGSGQCYGLSLEQVREVCRTADLFINISASAYMREEYLNIPRRMLIDSDPMFTQVQDWSDSDPGGSFEKIKNGFNQYNYLFSFGENINADDCRIPRFGLDWRTTRQPICLNAWAACNDIDPSAAFTTVMNWSTRKNLVYAQEEWGQKDAEFEKIARVPCLLGQSEFRILVADSSKKLDRNNLEKWGWQTDDPLQKISNMDAYRSFIESSVGEFSVAKETYVKSRSGWFSCRSACYLAAGRPVVTQETGWSNYLPAGSGLFSFCDMDSAIEALQQVQRDVRKNSKSAKEIARAYFDSHQVLNNIIQQL